jgi:PAS domain S-box-containing protein
VIPTPDFRTLFEAAPGLYLVLTPDLRIAAVSNAYLQATGTRREDILGRHLFEAFPDHRDDTRSTGVHTLSRSLARVLATRAPDTMAIQKYGSRRAAGKGAGVEERYWCTVNSPVFDDDRYTVAYIIHHVEDVTDLVHVKERLARLEGARWR